MAVGILVLAAAPSARAQQSYGTIGSVYPQNFDTLLGPGTPAGPAA